METMNARIIRINKTGYSCYGNPHHYITIEDTEGNIYHARTVTNAACGYGIQNKGVGDKSGIWVIQYHYTRNGSMMIDYME